MDENKIIEDVLARHNGDGLRLMQILRETQEALGWLSPATLAAIAAGVARPFADVSGVAGFYSFFHTTPQGLYRVLWSDNITDRMLDNNDLMLAMCQKLWLEPGRVSEDGLVSVGVTSCTGMCDQGPALLVNYRAVTRMDSERVKQMVELIRSRTPLTEWPQQWFEVEDNIRRSDVLLNCDAAAGQALQAALQRGGEAMLAELQASKLRGRGGAGFTTAQKWAACRAAPGEAHYVICNADEGEPGTFKDRVLLNRKADLVFEGMTIAALVVGARRGYMYLRGEYRYLLEPLQAVLAARRSAGLLGRNILGAGLDFDIEIHLGAGAYVCGEESALIESLEGKRGIPRNRPPWPVTHGFRNQPTVVNNVETFAAAALVALHDGAWFAAIGTAQSTGTKLLSVSGDCERPGIYEYPFGVAVSQVLADCGARNTQSLQISGPSGICLGPDDFSRCIAFEDAPCAGSFMIFDIHRDIFEMVRNFVDFFAHESCGFCTPCRVGTTLLKNLMRKIAAGRGARHDINEIHMLSRLLQASAHCGLGHTACNPLLQTLEKFRPAYERRLQSLDFEPAFDLDAALSQARQMTGRDDAGAHLNQSGE